jgi:outer membrane immunogenic protein
MRRLVVLAAVMVVTAHGVLAADMPDLPVLRGFVNDGPPASRTTWQGFYVGGQGAYGSSEMDFTNATRDVTAKLLSGTAIEKDGQVSTWPVLSKQTVHGSGFGGFVGYNAQWEDAVIGIEANYLHGALGGTGSGTMSRFFIDSTGYTDAVTYTGTASMQIHDSGSLRMRGGWAWNCLLPYAFGGLALGIADITRTTHVSGSQTNVNAAPGFTFVPFDLTATSSQNNHLIFGYSLGAGVDVMLIGGLFARGEFEYAKFVAPINTAVSTVRGGLGYKF